MAKTKKVQITLNCLSLLTQSAWEWLNAELQYCKHPTMKREARRLRKALDQARRVLEENKNA